MLVQNQMKKISINEYRDKFCFPIKNYYVKLGFTFENNSFEKIGTEFIEEYKKYRYDAELYPEVIKLLKDLKNNGISNSILSAQYQPLLDDHIKYYNIGNNFLKIIGLDNHYASSKIDNGFKLIQDLNIDINNILMVGDTDHDYEVADAIGIDCILLSHGHNSISRLNSTKALVVKNLSELSYFLKIQPLN
tara:strand:+ start:524 stop:1096 length:573 start_codon:yes stop_codon:yes gene_type:complete